MGAIRIGAVIAKKYRLEAPLARGGMGSVWAARHISLDRQLAVKFISPEVAGSEDVRTRFDREAKAAASIESPNVVQIHDYGVDGDVPYLVMELLHGEDLGACLAERGRLSLPEAVSLVTQVARALRRLAEAGIVHRDLKPSNIFIVQGDDEEEEVVKILDFGVAKAPRIAIGDTTKTGAMVGSPRYMSPEQVRGSPLVDHRSDLWSLAVIAYRALTGQLPFQGTDVADLVVKICKETPAPPSEIEGSLGPEIDDFFAKAFARSPDARFQTAREMATAFACAAGEPPPSVSSAQLARVVPPGAPALAPASLVTPTFVAASARGLEVTRRSFGPEPTFTSPPGRRPGSARSELMTAPEPFVTRRSGALEDGTRTTVPEGVDLPPYDAERSRRRVRLWHPIAAALLAAGIVAVVSLVQSLGGPAASPEVAQSSTPSATVAPWAPTSAEAPPPPLASEAPGAAPTEPPSLPVSGAVPLVPPVVCAPRSSGIAAPVVAPKRHSSAKSREILGF